jgi:hypothetical protein
MMFAKRLRAAVMAGEITTSIRLWQRPHVRIGGRYPLGGGAIEVTGLTEIDLDDVTEAMAVEGGFASLDDLMSVARHGRGERVFLVEFVYRPD